MIRMVAFPSGTMPISRPVGKQPPGFAKAVPFDGTPRVRPMCLHGEMPAGTAPRNRHTRRSWSLLPSRGQPYGRVEKSLPRLTNLGGELASFSPLLFRRGVHLECKVSFRGRGDEKASGDRVFCHFIDGRDVVRRRLAAGTAALPFGPSHARRMDRHLFWSQRRLWLGIGLIKYRFWRWIDERRAPSTARHDDATWPRRDGARWYGPFQLKQSARRHCWRSNRFQLASRNGRLRSRA